MERIKGKIKKTITIIRPITPEEEPNPDKDYKDKREEWEDTFFKYLVRYDDIEIISYDKIINSERYKSYTAKEKFELIQFIWETYGIMNGEYSVNSYRELLTFEKEKWLFLYNVLSREIEVEAINYEIERIKNELNNIKDIEEKIDFLEIELKDIEQSKILNANNITENKYYHFDILNGIDKVIRYIEIEKKYLESEQKKMIKRQNQAIQMQFKDLFKIPYNTDEKINELKQILQTHHYIDNTNIWIGVSEPKLKSELANLYWLFVDGNNIIKSGKVAPQLKTFYKEFGLTAYDEKESKGYVTIKNINSHTGQTESYKRFEKLFYNWVNTEK